MGQLFGSRSVLATSGDTHKRQRKLLNPHFHGAKMKALGGVMASVIRAHSDRLTTGDLVVMSEFAQALTLDVILETAFGADKAFDRAHARDVLLGAVSSISPVTVFSRFLRTPRFPPWRRFLDARARFDGWIDDLVRERRARDESGSDLLGLLLDVQYDDGAGLSDAEIRDQLMALLVAGHETTAVALAWAVYWLHRDPATLARLRGELATHDATSPPESIGRLPYLQAVISETLRIEPIVTDVPRVCRSDLSVGEWTVPAGEAVIINISAILADPDLFPAPHEFRPERFLDRTFSVGEFMPFGGGHRRCLGAAFAELELAIAIAEIAGRWDLALADASPEKAVRRNVTMGPARGVRVKVVGRRRAPD
jgi:cytochrome P450